MDNKKPIPGMTVYDVTWMHANDHNDTSKLIKNRVLIVEHYTKFEDIRSVIALSAWGNPKLIHRVEIFSIQLVLPEDE